MDINKIAQLADNMNKSAYNKNAIYASFRDALTNDGQFNELAMAKLYAYFMPNTPAKPKTDEQWVALAKPTNDVRYYLNYLYSDGNRIMATDGHRLHILNKSIEPGFYNKEMIKIEVDGKFPDVDRNIPECNKHMFFSEAKLADFEDNGKICPVYQINDVTVNAAYMKKACSGFTDPVILYSDKRHAIVIKDDNKMAVVMPMRV
jgi:hypothetical protein